MMKYLEIKKNKKYFYREHEIIKMYASLSLKVIINRFEKALRFFFNFFI